MSQLVENPQKTNKLLQQSISSLNLISQPKKKRKNPQPSSQDQQKTILSFSLVISLKNQAQKVIKQMRAREVIDFLIYPRVFLSLAIPYKGQYFLRIRVYEKKVLNGKIAYAYPRQHSSTESIPTKTNHPSRVSITQKDVFFDTQSFPLTYSNSKVNLSSYCFFTLEYDQCREFKTFIELQLIRKHDLNVSNEGCLTNSTDQMGEEDSICKEIYLVNNYKRLDMFERVYFQHWDFYCALDLYLASVNLGTVLRSQKFQLVGYSLNPTQFKKTQSTSNKVPLSVPELISQVHDQVDEYTQFRKTVNKYQQFIKAKKSFLFQSLLTVLVQTSPELSYVKHSFKDFEKSNPQQAYAQLFQDKRNINQNIKYLFNRLPSLIKNIPLSTFKTLIMQSMTRKYELKKKYLLKRVTQSSHFNPSSYFEINNHQSHDYIKLTSLRYSFPNTSHLLGDETIRTSFTFKQSRKMEKKEFVHVRRQQFIKSSRVISLKECSFPMLLIEKSLTSTSTLEMSRQQHPVLAQKSRQNVIEQHSHDNFGTSLIILIHGYQGSHHDLNKIRNYLEYLSPQMKILSITSIEKSTNEGIQYLAEKIAAEIQFYVENSYEVIRRINFIGFSLGGVLARACLKHLGKYQKLMNLLITLASPHLGVSESDNPWVNLGLWYLSRVDKVKNIKQLNFQSVTQKDSFLMRLSKEEQISWFTKVVIISSSEDEFVPHYSARIIGSTKNPQINDMAHNIISRIRSYDRIEVWFDVDKKSSIDKIIGRKSHIEFIENYAFLQMLCKIYEQQL